MHPRHATLARLADAFGRCVSANLECRGNRIAFPSLRQRDRLQKIARIMDRLSRSTVGATWHQRAARIHREMAAFVGETRRHVRPSSLWATA